MDTDMSRILQGCCAYVWQRVDGDQHAHHSLTARLTGLGCKVVTRLQNKITHIIFQRKCPAEKKERAAEDADLRKLYSWLATAGSKAVIVSPLWIRASEESKAPAQVKRHIERKPPDPMFFSRPLNLGFSSARRKRKSCTARPREQVEVPDLNDAIFSSSQQIRELNETSGGSLSDDDQARRAGGSPALSDVEEDEEMPPRDKPSGAGRSSAVPAGGATRKAQSERKPAAPQPQLAGAKRAMRQLPLNFALISKKPRPLLPEEQELPAAADKPVSTHPLGPKEPAAERSAAHEQRAQVEDKRECTVKVAEGVEAAHVPAQRKMPDPPNTGLQKPPAAVRPLPPGRQQEAGGSATPEPASALGARPLANPAARYPALPCAVVPVGGEDFGRLTGLSLSEVPSRRSLGAAAPALLAAAAADGGPKSVPRPLSVAANAARVSALPPRAPVLQKPNSDGGVDARVAVAACSKEKEGCVAEQAAGADSVAAAAPAAFALAMSVAGAPPVHRASAPRRSRSLSSTPLGAALHRSLARLTPLATPKGLNPRDLVVPKLKPQGGVTPAAAAAPAPADSNKATAEQRAAKPELAVQAGISEPAASAGGAGTTVASFRHSPSAPRRRDSTLEAGEENAAPWARDAAGARAAAAAGLTASARSSARARGLLPPTPPTAPFAAAAGHAGPAVAWPPLPLQACRQEVEDATLQVAAADAPRSKTEAEAERSISAGNFARRGPGHSGEDSDEEGTDRNGRATTGRRSRRRARPAELGVPLSPVIHPPAAKPGTGEPAAAAAVAAVASVSAASLFAGPIPIRRSARLIAGVPPACAPGSRPPPRDRAEAEKVSSQASPSELRVARHPRTQEQQHQQASPGAAWAGFQPAVQRSQQEASLTRSPQKGRCGELACLIKQGAAWRSVTAALPPEDRATAAAAAGCMPATTRKGLGQRQAAALEATGEAEQQLEAQQHEQLYMAPASRPTRQREGSTPGALCHQAVILPSPALCTRSRVRAAAATPYPPPSHRAAAAHQQQEQQQVGDRKEPDGRSPQNPKGNGSPAGCGACLDARASALPSQAEDVSAGQPRLEGGGAADAARTPAAETEAPAATAAAAATARGRPGSVTRSRRRAMESELACAARAQLEAGAGAPSSAAVRRVRAAAFARTAALLEGEAEVAAAKAQAAAQPEPQARLGTQGAVPADAADLSLRPTRPNAASQRTACGTASQGDRAQPSGATAMLAAEAKAGSGGGAAGQAHNRPPLPPASATPVGLGVAASTSLRSGSRRPTRTSTRKRLLNTQPATASAPGDDCASGKRRGTSSGPDAGDGARTDGGAAGLAAAVAATAAAKPAGAARPASRPAPPRSRLRLKRQNGDAAPKAEEEPGGGMTKVKVGAGPGPAARAAPTQGTAKRRRTMSPAAPQPTSVDSENLANATGAAATAPASAKGRTSAGGPSPGVGDVAPPPRSGQAARVPGRAGSARKALGMAAATPDVEKTALRAADSAAGLSKLDDIQRGLFRSVALTSVLAAPPPHRPTSVCLGVAASKLSRLEAYGAAAEAPAALMVPALGQYPRGKEHPMRAGYRYLVHTRVGKETEATIERAIKQLGNARLCTPGYEDRHVTHLVLGDSQTRTVKVLLGIANGALFVTPAWVEASLAAGKWLPEDAHLATGAFAVTARAVRAQLQTQLLQQQQRGAGAAVGTAAAAAGQAAEPGASVVARPLYGRMVAVHNVQCKGPGLGELQKRKADVEKLVVALGGRVVPIRSAGLLVVVGGAGTGGGSASQTERRQVQSASEEWLLRLAETHVWEEP